MARRRSGEQPVRAPTGGNYGARRQLEAAQGAVPLPNNDPASTVPAATSGGGGGGRPAAPVQAPDVFAPTQRPGEPLTAGSGPEGFGMLPADPVETLRAIYLRSPSSGVRRLLEYAAAQRRPR